MKLISITSVVTLVCCNPTAPVAPKFVEPTPAEGELLTADQGKITIQFVSSLPANNGEILLWFDGDQSTINIYNVMDSCAETNNNNSAQVVDE